MSGSDTIARPPSPPHSGGSSRERLDDLVRVAAHPTLPEIDDAPGLAAVLARDAELVGLICEALTQAHLVFGEHATLRLEPFSDPEVVNPGPEVFLVVQAALDLDVGGQLLDQLYESWWLDNSHRASGTLSITLAFV